MIIQGSNNPLIITFDTDITVFSVLVITLWSKSGCAASPLLIKTWGKEDMRISENVAVCPISEEETAGIAYGQATIEAKGLDQYGNTMFWDSYPLNIQKRLDREIRLVQTKGG